jgi:peptidoglycan/LPS O-acetylase OafA/YrhL
VRGTVLAAFFALFILTAADEQGVPAIKRLFQARFLGTLGKYIYGLYVFHGLIAYAFERHGLRAQLEHELGSRALATVVQAAAGIGLSLTIAVASYELYEVRFLSLKKLFSDGRARRAEAERKRAPLEHKFVAQAELATPAEPRAASPIAGRGSP